MATKVKKWGQWNKRAKFTRKTQLFDKVVRRAASNPMLQAKVLETAHARAIRWLKRLENEEIAQKEEQNRNADIAALNKFYELTNRTMPGMRHYSLQPQNEVLSERDRRNMAEKLLQRDAKYKLRSQPIDFFTLNALVQIEKERAIGNAQRISTKKFDKTRTKYEPIIKLEYMRGTISLEQHNHLIRIIS